MEKRSIRCVVPICETTHQKVRNAYRKKLKERYEDGKYCGVYIVQIGIRYSNYLGM